MTKEIPIKTENEIEIMREGGKILSKIFSKIRTKIISDITTKEIEDFSKMQFKKYKVKPSFLGYKGYPSAVCISINEEWVHGIPSQKKIKDGDIVTIDLGVLHKGFHTDAAATYTVGKIKRKERKLLKATKEALYAGIKQARYGNRIGDISYAIQKRIEQDDFSVMRDYSGHGVGKNLHEAPDIPDYGERGTGQELKAGMVLALEPMTALGKADTKVLNNGWTVISKDRSKTAHFEKTIVITSKNPELIT